MSEAAGDDERGPVIRARLLGRGKSGAIRSPIPSHGAQSEVHEVATALALCGLGDGFSWQIHREQVAKA